MEKELSVLVDKFNAKIAEAKKNGTPDSPLGWQNNGPHIYLPPVSK